MKIDIKSNTQKYMILFMLTSCVRNDGVDVEDRYSNYSKTGEDGYKDINDNNYASEPVMYESDKINNENQISNVENNHVNDVYNGDVVKNKNLYNDNSNDPYHFYNVNHAGNYYSMHQSEPIVENKLTKSPYLSDSINVKSSNDSLNDNNIKINKNSNKNLNGKNNKICCPGCGYNLKDFQYNGYELQKVSLNDHIQNCKSNESVNMLSDTTNSSGFNKQSSVEKKYLHNIDFDAKPFTKGKNIGVIKDVSVIKDENYDINNEKNINGILKSSNFKHEKITNIKNIKEEKIQEKKVNNGIKEENNKKRKVKWPIPGTITKKFSNTNSELEITPIGRQPIKAHKNMKVVHIGDIGDNRSVIVLKDSNDIISSYTNVTDLKVDLNDDVNRNSIIGYADTSAVAVEAIKNKKYIDPENYVRFIYE